MKARDDNDMEKFVKSFLKQWAVPGASALLFCTAWGIRMETAIREAEKDRQELRSTISRLTTVGPDGVVDPSTHSTFDSQLRHALGEYDLLSRKDFADWCSHLRALNDGKILVPVE